MMIHHLLSAIIIHICILFFDYDEWDKAAIGTDLEIDPKNRNIVKYRGRIDLSTCDYHSAFLQEFAILNTVGFINGNSE